MNKFIKEQLKKCTVAKIPPFDDDTTKIFIPKSGNRSKIMEKDKYYLIRIDKSKISNTIKTNWNNGVDIKSQYLVVSYIKSMSDLWCFDGCDYILSDTANNYYYRIWLPDNSFEIINEIGD